MNRRDTRTLSADRMADTAGTPRGVFMLVCPASSAPPGFHTFGKYLVDGSLARSSVCCIDRLKPPPEAHPKLSAMKGL